MPKTAKPAPTEDDLSRQLDHLEATLSKSEPEKPDTAADLAKAMATVATKAIDLAAEDRQGTRRRRKAKAEVEEAEELAKASKDDDKDDEDDDDEDDDDDDKPAWLNKLTDDGKAAGEMILAPDRTSMGTHQMTNANGESRSMSKSVQLGDQEVVDVEEYLSKALAEQVDLGKSLRRLNKLAKALTEGLVAIDQRLADLDDRQREQARFSGVMAKGLGYLLEHREAALDAPTTGSRYARMEKSVVLAQRQLEADGATLFKCTGPGSERNRELLAKAVQTGKLTSEQMIHIKRTERLPAGLSLN